MKIDRLVRGLTAALLLTPAVGLAEETVWIPRVIVGNASYELSEPYVGSSKMASSDYTYVGGGLTMHSPSMYLDFFITKSRDAEHDLFAGGKNEFERTDWAITLGFPLSEASNFYIGYKVGESAFGAPTGALFTSRDVNASGMFLGVSAGLPIGSRLALILNGAMAFMSAEITDDHRTNPMDTSSDYALGFTGSVGLNFTFTDSFSANLTYKYESYTYEGFQLIQEDIDETIGSLNLSLSYAF